MPPTYSQLLQQASARLAGQTDTPRLDAELLLAHALQKARSHLTAWPERQAEPAQAAQFEELLARRLKGEPVAYILGEREFWSLPLRVTPATLIPRPDTEILVEAALEKIPPNAPCRVLDLGTGTGAIALAVKSERPLAEVHASDRSAQALDVARGNGTRLGLNVSWHLGEWWQPFAGERFDVVVSNPPYVAVADTHLERGDLRFEPRGALAAGDDGLDDLRRIVEAAPGHLRAGGWLLLEHGHDQAEAVAALLAAAGMVGLGCRRDLAGHLRVSLAACSGGTP